MHFSIATLISTFAFLSVATARIAGFRALATVAAGEPFQVSLLIGGYIQRVYDVAVVFGITSRSMTSGGIGTVIGSDYLGPDRSNTGTMLNFIVTTDAPSTPSGKYTLSAAVMSVYGVSGIPILESWNVTLLVGDATAMDTVDILERN